MVYGMQSELKRGKKNFYASVVAGTLLQGIRYRMEENKQNISYF